MELKSCGFSPTPQRIVEWRERNLWDERQQNKWSDNIKKKIKKKIILEFQGSIIFINFLKEGGQVWIFYKPKVKIVVQIYTLTGFFINLGGGVLVVVGPPQSTRRFVFAGLVGVNFGNSSSWICWKVSILTLIFVNVLRPNIESFVIDAS